MPSDSAHDIQSLMRDAMAELPSILMETGEEELTFQRLAVEYPPLQIEIIRKRARIVFGDLSELLRSSRAISAQKAIWTAVEEHDQLMSEASQSSSAPPPPPLREFMAARGFHLTHKQCKQLSKQIEEWNFQQLSPRHYPILLW